MTSDEGGPSRVISFRLSNTEYVQLQTQCESISLGSVAELARCLMREFLRAGGDPLSLVVISNLKQIEEELDRLSRQIHMVYRQTLEQHTIDASLSAAPREKQSSSS